MAGHRAAPRTTGAPVAGRRRALELVAHLVRVGGGPARATFARGARARDRGPVARRARRGARALPLVRRPGHRGVVRGRGAARPRERRGARRIPRSRGVRALTRRRVPGAGGAPRRRGRDRCGRPPRPAQGPRHARRRLRTGPGRSARRPAGGDRQPGARPGALRGGVRDARRPYPWDPAVDGPGRHPRRDGRPRRARPAVHRARVLRAGAGGGAGQRHAGGGDRSRGTARDRGPRRTGHGARGPAG